MIRGPIEQTISDWLADEAPYELDELVLDATFARSRRTRQVGRAPVRRLFTMNRSFAVAAGAVAIVLAVVGAALFLRPGTQPVATEPSAAPSALSSAAALVTTPSTAAVAPSVATAETSPAQSSLSTADWTTFTSARYGYSMRVPPGWSQAPTSGRWKLAQTDEQPKPADHLRGDSPLDGSPGEEFSAFAADLQAGTSQDAWIAAFFAPHPKPGHTPCLDQLDNYSPVDVQGHQAVLWTESHISTACGGDYAFVTVGHRLYAFELGGGGQERLLMAILSTVTLPG